MEIDKSIFEKYSISMEELTPKIIDTIVEVYGEKNRSLIEDRLNRIYINSYATYEHIQSDYYAKLTRVNNMIGIKFLREIGIEVSRRNRRKCL